MIVEKVPSTEPLAKLPQPDELVALLAFAERACRWIFWPNAANSAIWTTSGRMCGVDRLHRFCAARSGRVRGYATSRIICSTVTTRMPNIRWQNTFGAPRTRTWLPPQLSFKLPLTRSPELRWL